jgi:hypothetical protein
VAQALNLPKFVFLERFILELNVRGVPSAHAESQADHEGDSESDSVPNIITAFQVVERKEIVDIRVLAGR